MDGNLALFCGYFTLIWEKKLEFVGKASKRRRAQPTQASGGSLISVDDPNQWYSMDECRMDNIRKYVFLGKTKVHEKELVRTKNTEADLKASQNSEARDAPRISGLSSQREFCEGSLTNDDGLNGIFK